MSRRNVVLPFRTLEASGSIECSDWYARWPDSSDVVSLDPRTGLRDWSYDTDVIVGREVVVDVPVAMDFLGLDTGSSSLIVAATIKSGSLGSRRKLAKQTIQGTEKCTLNLESRVASKKLCESMTLRTSIFLGEQPEECATWSPKYPGSRLWEDEVVIPIEGSKGRFPMRDVDFSSNPRLDGDADWHLDWLPSLLHYSFNSSVSLLLNSAKTDFLERLEEGDALLEQQIMNAIVDEICTYLLQKEDFTNPEEPFPSGSLGAMASAWLRDAYPNCTMAEIRERYLFSPGLFSTKLRGLVSRF